MARIYSGEVIPITQDEFNDFIDQYLHPNLNIKNDLVRHVKHEWIHQVHSYKTTDYVDIELPTTKGRIITRYPDGAGAYAIFVRHPNDCPDIWVCFYVGISEKRNICGRVAQHHSDDAKLQSSYKWLAECSDTFSCFLRIENALPSKKKLELLEFCLNGEFRPWKKAIEGGFARDNQYVSK